MATYVNDLRLKEIATGDESGTWGTSTNTNLELIAEGFSYATVDPFDTDADKTETMADGATDPIRSLYLKVTSTATLTATRTLTLAPNTVSKVWIIENATTGGQSISISQGSGSNVTIPNGDVKVIYTDGAGATAAVTDAFANLKVTDPAQTNITSVGTLTGFTSTGIDDNATGTAILIENDRNVGINTTSLVSSAGYGTLTLNGSTGGQLAFQTAETGKQYIYSTSTDFNILNTAAGNITLGTNNTERMRINSSGNVGIGTSSPTGNLVVVNSGGGGLNIGYNATSTNYYDANTQIFRNGSFAEKMRIDTSGYLLLGTTTTPSSSDTKLVVSSGSGAFTQYSYNGGAGSVVGSPATSQMAFYTYTGNVGSETYTERMRIDSSGMLLVNTTSSWGGETNPHIESRSDVIGDYTGLIVSNTNDAAGDSVSINFGLARDGGLVFGNAGKITVGKEQDWTTVPTTIDGFMSFSVQSNETLTERMRIDSSGNVGIGTSSPALPLHVYTTGGNLARFTHNTATPTTTYITAVNANNTSNGTVVAHISDGTSYIGNQQNAALRLVTNDTERMRIASSGYVGIGTTSPTNKLHVYKAASGRAWSPDGNDLLVIENNDSVALDIRTPDSNQGLILFSDASARARGSIAYLHSSDYMYMTTAGTERMRIDSSGNVGIGTTNPAQKLTVYGSDNNNLIMSSNSGGNSNTMRIQANDAASYIVSSAAVPLIFDVQSSEAMRVLTSGALCVGRTSAITSSSVAAAFQTSAADNVPAIDVGKVSGTTSSSAYFISFHASSGGTAMGAIAGNGAANVQFIAVSDERLKENIQPLSGSLNKVLALNPVSYDWKENGEHIEAGFVAQEVEQVLPEYVSTKNDENQTKSLTGGMTAGYIAVLTKAIQEQQVLIEQLQAEVALLKGE